MHRFAILLLLSTLALTASAETLELRNFRIGMSCSDAVKVAEASLRSGMQFRPRWQDGVRACEPEKDGSGVRGLALSASGHQFKDAIFIEVGDDGRVWRIQANTTWGFGTSDPPPEMSEISSRLVEKYGPECRRAFEESKGGSFTLDSEFSTLSLYWTEPYTRALPCDQKDSAQIQEWRQRFAIANGAKRTAQITNMTTRGRPNSRSLTILLEDDSYRERRVSRDIKL